MDGDDRSMRMLTVKEVAQILHISINTVRQWSDRGMLRSYRIGSRGDRRFFWNDIEDFLERSRGNGLVAKAKRSR